MNTNPKSSDLLIVITGPTASGKTGLSLKLAEKFGGEIICADSRTVYKDMDIGTAKPTKAEQKIVPHWLLDVVCPSERFTVHDFQHLANQAIADIRSRGKIPFIVGGTGLYIDSVILDFQLAPRASSSQRDLLEKMTNEELQSLIMQQQLVMPENKFNKRYLIRCIEKNNAITSSKVQPEGNVVVVAVDVDKDTLRQRISLRTEAIFADEIVRETQQLFESYDKNCQALTGNIYPIVGQMLDGTLTKEQAVERVIARDWQLAKRQITWLKRHDYVHWLSLTKAEAFIDKAIVENQVLV